MLYQRFLAPSSSRESLIKEPIKPFQEELIVVHISGAVARSGVYKLKKNSRIIDALYAAGTLKSADLDNLNLAEAISDGQKITIPYRKTSSQIAIDQNPANAFGKVNLNTADIKALDTLPGIGPSTAQKILDYRKSHGFFKTIEELMEVPGIGEAKFNKLKKLITL